MNMFNRQIFFVFAFMLIFVSFSYAWANKSFPYRKKIDITSSTQLTDYQVALNITYNQNMQNDFDDIRFYASDDTTKLSYWIENKVNGSWAYVWVKVPVINSTSYIYMYYGNSTAVSESNGTNTFIFFDDFESYANNSNIDGQGGWITKRIGGTGSAKVINGHLQLYSTSSGTAVVHPANLTNSIEAFGSYYINSWSGEPTMFLAFSDGQITSVGDVLNGYNLFWWQGASKSIKYQRWVNGGATDLNLTADITPSTGQYYRVASKWVGNQFISTRNFSVVKMATDSYYTSQTYLHLGVWAIEDYRWDWVAVRKATQTEPSYSIGSEEAGSIVSILYPTNGIYINQSQIDINFSLNYNEPNDCNLYINGTLNDTKTNLQAGNYSFTNKTFLDGQHNIKINCSNAGAQSGIISFTIDTTKPSISITSPLNNSYLGKTITITGTSSDTNYNYTNISIWQGSTLINSTTTTNTSWSVQLGVQNDGIYNITATAYDYAQNSNDYLITITADATNPQLTASYSFSDWETKDISSQIQINFTASDANYNYTKIEITYLNDSIFYSQNYTETQYSANITLPSSAEILKVNITAYDKAGNTNISTRGVKTLDYTEYNSYINVTDKYINDQDCYDSFILNGITYRYPKVYENGTFINSKCKTSYWGFDARRWGGAYASIVENKIYKGDFQGTTQTGSSNMNLNKILYDFSEDRNLTIYSYFYGSSAYGTTDTAILISNGTNSISTSVSNGNVKNISFNKNGSICVDSNCINGFNRQLEINITLSGLTCDSDLGGACNSDASFTYMSNWILNNSIVGFNNTQIKYNNALKDKISFGFQQPYSNYGFSEVDRTFYKNATVIFPIIIPFNYIYWKNYTASSTYYQANIFTSSGNLIKPQWITFLSTYIDSSNTIQLALYNAYAPDSFISNIIPNNAFVVKDNITKQCYFIPAFNPANISILQTMVGYVIPCESTIINSLNLPLIPQYVTCYERNGTYHINSTSKYEILHKVYYYDTSNNIHYDGELSQDFTRSYQLSSYPVVRYIVGNTTYCFYNSSQTSLLGLSNMNVSSEIKNMIIFPLFLFSAGLSVYNPFVFILPIAINDTFQLFSITQIILIGILISISAFVFAHNTNKTLKNGFMYIAILLAYISVYSMNSNVGDNLPINSQISSIQGNMTAFTQSLEPNDTNLLGMITNSVNIALTLAGFVVTLPIQVLALIFNSITMAIPVASPILSVFQSFLIIAVYMWIIIRLYEMLRNVFREI